MPKSAGRSRRHVADISLLEKYGASLILDDDQQPAGFEISGWKISTKSSPIGNEGEMDALTAIVQDSVKDSRRLALPEIVFVQAFISLQYSNSHKNNIAELEKEDGNESDLQAGITFNAQDALVEWAECHSHLPLPPNDGSNASYKGVSIIKTVDAKLWEERQAREKQQVSSNGSAFGAGAAAAALEKCSTEFNYDWTYSSPYLGTIIPGQNWKQETKSGIDMKLLTDQTQPILYFDDVNIYEDDMHDNGYVSLRCKIRAMPTCFFVLLSLFVRVDLVLLRVKEVRYFCKFNANENSEEPIQVHRDVVWKECSWSKLASIGLPTHIGSWRVEDELNMGQREQQRIQGMLRSLPEIELPSDVHKSAYFDVK
jgi:type 2A phosphatase activator TIP41